MRKRKLIYTGILAASLIISAGYAEASSIQTQSPAKIFGASCSTCHGGAGLGGVTFIKDGPSDKRVAPKIAGLGISTIKSMVRWGSGNGAMPAFGPQEITDMELNNLATWLNATPAGVTLEPAPTGTVVRLDILDADPWYADDGSDSEPDSRRVDLATGDTLKVVNTGRTWHTLTNSDDSVKKDSGFIGYAGNYKDVSIPNDLDQGQPNGIGYYLASEDGDGINETTDGLAPGCVRYLCKMHPYMQVEVCAGPGPDLVDNTTDDNPLGPTAPLGLTRAHKHGISTGCGPNSTSPCVAGIGEVWVTAQSQEEVSETGTTTVVNRSVSDMDGAYQVIDASNWSVSYIPNVGNNPHNAWPGKDGGGADVVLSADWHDNTVVLMSAATKSVLARKRSGAGNAHVMVTPGSAGKRFFVTHMGGRAIQEINVNRLEMGYDPNYPNRPIRSYGTGPHGLWACSDGNHIMTADTFGGSASWYNITKRTATTASSKGKAPLAPAIFENVSGTCSRAFTNNALTTDVSVYDITGDTITKNTSWTDPNNPAAGGAIKKPAGVGEYNIALRNTTTDQGVSPFMPTETIKQARWAHLPIQTPVSPKDATTHGRFMLTANKASFNVSVTALDGSGNPTGLYTFPAGLGAHGVTYGKKSLCDTANPADICYYAYVTNTLEDYVSVYDLEKIATAGPAGSALIAETAYVEGGAVEAVIALDTVTASLCDVIEITAIGGCGAASTITGGPTTSVAFGGPVTLATVGAYDVCLTDGTPGPLDVLDCGVGAMDGVSVSAGGTLGVGAVFVSNLPIGVLCPDCRSGVHVGDIPLTLTTGEALGAGATAALATNPANDLGIADSPTTNDGFSAKYTYLKEDVWVDTDTVACVVNTMLLPPGTVNDCIGATSGALGGNTAGAVPAGTINTQLTLDLELGINTGGQGIVASPAATPWP